MKIICVFKNFNESGTAQAARLSFYLKPETALLPNNRPFYYPEYTNEIGCNAELVLKINKVGKYIGERFAHKYYDEIGLAINMKALDLQKDCIKNKNPWEVSYSFDNSAPLSKFNDKSLLKASDNINYSLKLNGKTVENNNSSELLFSFDKIVSHISQYIILKTGDLIFTGARTKPAAIKINDILEGYINEQCILKCRIK